ncbi:peptidase E [Patulibacter brassicae]|uniref:Peptidase E n=1 Tax=Patulibacter brassicae TaxID=1705717 RepID=A0ABU4VJE2_9ACTN|nr:peptidase E [Patulibacter brassicae]MDX8151959.1 peptidase E [Patulibacter brassicae]
MTDRPPRIVALGGGGFSMEPRNPLMDDFVLELSGAEQPRICFLPTASGDADHYVVRFYRRFGAGRADPSHVSLFRRDRSAGAVEGNLEEHLLSQDVIYVGGGSLLSLLGTWRAHGLDRTLRRAWERGVLLCGLSAGSLCWFADAVTAFHGPSERVRGLGLLPHSNCVHYDGEPERRAAFRELVAGGLRPGYGVEDGAALVFEGTELQEVVTSRRDATAYAVRVGEDGAAHEHRLTARYLGADDPATAAPPAEGLAVAGSAAAAAPALALAEDADGGDAGVRGTVGHPLAGDAGVESAVAA